MTEPVYVDIYQKGAVVKMYFSAVVDAEPASWGAFCGEEVFAGERSRTGVGAGVYLRFDTRARRDVGVKIEMCIRDRCTVRRCPPESPPTAHKDRSRR